MRSSRSSFLLPILGLLTVIGLSSCGDSTEPGVQPTILLINPRGVESGHATFQLTVVGENIGDDATVYWNGEARESSRLSTDVVAAIIPAEDVLADGTASITVGRPDGSRSTPKTFTVGEYLEPEMTLTAVDPTQGTVGAGDTEITVTGTGFIPGAAVFVQYGEMETTWISSTMLRAVVPSVMFQGSWSLDLRIGFSEVWVSTVSFPWQVVAPVPVISSLSPASASAGSESVQVRVLGSGFTSTFTSSSTIQVNGVERQITFVNEGEVGVILTAFDLTSPGTLAITVENPPPGGGTSPALDFIVTP